MTAPTPIDKVAARAAARELIRVTALRRTRPADVAHVQLPLALELLDHVGGDPVCALFVLADLADPDHLTADDIPAAGPHRPPGPRPRLRVVPTNPPQLFEGRAL